MDSKVVVGVGNIYASESLFLAEISPLRSASTITREECEKLVEVIRKLLHESIKKGGTTIRDFSGADGKPGYFVQNLNVYGHEGEKCPRCGHPILGTGTRAETYLFLRDIASTKNLVNIFIVYKLSNCRRYERGDIAAVNDYVTYERR